ncbi:MAG: DUF975 family protein [Lachnospiraceae bacterium]|nr:DUF975 family protein [Lachnospiraceae bacterium]
MWNINEVKAKAKDAFKGNYWPCVGAGAILWALVGGSSIANRNNGTSSEEIQNVMNGLSPEEAFAFSAAIFGGATVIFIVSLLLKIFIFNPLEVGCYLFFRKNVEETPAKFGIIKEGFNGYGHVFLTLFLRDLFLGLWFCLFIIPGLIKLYSYKMVPFIIKDNPELSATQVITRSREMMNGHKWRAFLLDLSFIGWFLLGVITLGIVNIFWTNPYSFNADAQLYLELKKGGQQA